MFLFAAAALRRRHEEPFPGLPLGCCHCLLLCQTPGKLSYFEFSELKTLCLWQTFAQVVNFGRKPPFPRLAGEELFTHYWTPQPYSSLRGQLAGEVGPELSCTHFCGALDVHPHARGHSRVCEQTLTLVEPRHLHYTFIGPAPRDTHTLPWTRKTNCTDSFTSLVDLLGPKKKEWKQFARFGS